MRDLFVVLSFFILGCVDTAPQAHYPTQRAAVPYEPPSIDLDRPPPDVSPEASPTIWDAGPDATDQNPPDVPTFCEPFGFRRVCGLPLSGPCAEGFAICLEDSWSDCNQETFPRAERCDGIDNNCDGIVDEDLYHPCYAGPPDTLKIGPCTGGTRECISGSFGECRGQTMPDVEICDLVDNDCDDLIDEGVTNLCGLCGPDIPELCNFVDEDCDGILDEGAGNCECDNPLYVPQPEICNGADEDCDGRIDEGPEGGPLARLCATAINGEVQTFERAEDGPEYEGGACRLGLAFCASRRIEGEQQLEYGYYECLQEIPPQVERCNGEDDDCDGLIDEAFEHGEVAVLFVVDVSGSMNVDELMEAFITTQQAVQRLHAQGIANACYALSIVGTDAVADPLLISPADQCVEGVQDPPENPRTDLVTAIARLRNSIDLGQIPRGGARENTLDAMGAWFTDDLIDVDQDGAIDEHLWFSDDPAAPRKTVDLQGVPHRIVVVLGDEESQGIIWSEEDVARVMRQSGGIAYILGPSEQHPSGRRVIQSYQEILDAGGVYVPMRGAGGHQEGEVANGILQAIAELECLAEE